MIWRRLRRRGGDDSGYTMVEVLVASSLFMMVNVFTFTAVITHAKVTEETRDATDLNQEARLLLNRMSRELREASYVSSSTNAGVHVYSPPYATFDPAATSALTFEVDFNGVNGIEPNAADPEVITYRYEPSSGQLLLQAGSLTTPVLASNVTAFRLRFSSRLAQYDGTINGTKDGVVTWEELDADPALVRGNGNHMLDALELQFVDAVEIELTLFKGNRKQMHRTQVDLRNRPY